MGDCQAHVLKVNWFSAALPIHLSVFGTTMKVGAVLFCFLMDKAEHVLQLSVAHFIAPISRSRLLSLDRELCFSRFRVKDTRSRRQIQNDKMNNSRYYPPFFKYFEKHSQKMNI